MQRVAKKGLGSHHIPSNVVERRYFKGIYNLVNLYIPVCNTWSVFDNTQSKSKFIAKGSDNLEETIFNLDIWEGILKSSYDSK